MGVAGEREDARLAFLEHLRPEHAAQARHNDGADRLHPQLLLVHAAFLQAGVAMAFPGV
jgi:hypothetical protein